MDILMLLLSILAGFLLSGIWFGLLFLFIGFAQRLVNLKWLLHLRTLFASIIPIVIIAVTVGLYPVQVEELNKANIYLVAHLTVLITTAIVSRKKQGVHRKGRELIIYGLDGAFMEIPQRLMMQSFIYGFLKLIGVSVLDHYTVLATALIWCMGIGIQALLKGEHFDKDLFIDLIASFVFSLGIGYVYQRTGLILITMTAHFLERILSGYVGFKRAR